jgi:type IV secretory pathway TrbD component
VRRSPVYWVLNKPLTYMGVDRRLFFASITLASVIWNAFDTLLGGILLFLVALIIGRYITATDPQLPTIVLNSRRFRDDYDPAKF